MNKKRWMFFVTLLFCGLVCGGAQDRLELIIGPRVGATYIFANREIFDTSMQQIFPDPERQYIPLITQFGVNVEQRIRLGDTRSHFAFQEVLVLGGLDQNFILPSLSTLIGFRSHIGLEFGLGPNFSLASKDGAAKITMSVVYAVGWTFSFQGVYVPVNIAIVPTPKDGHIRLTFLSGFNFAMERRRS